MALHFDYAMALIKAHPDADQTNSDSILFHLSRSYSPGDKNYWAYFWHARQLYIAGRHDEARTKFDTLKHSRIPYDLKNSVGHPIKGPDGVPKIFNGVVFSRTHSYGFVRADEADQTAYIPARDIEAMSTKLEEQDRVSFEIFFSSRGAVVRNLNKL